MISGLEIRRLILLYCLQVGPARFRAPELLFRPDLIGEECEGLHEVLVFAIQKSDMDLRRTLFSNIVLSGGSTLFKGSFYFSSLVLVSYWCSEHEYFRLLLSSLNLARIRMYPRELPRKNVFPSPVWGYWPSFKRLFQSLNADWVFGQIVSWLLIILAEQLRHQCYVLLEHHLSHHCITYQILVD